MDDEYQQLFSTLADHSSSFAGFSLKNGIILYKERVILSLTSPLKSLVLKHVHNSPLGGHSIIRRPCIESKKTSFGGV